MRRLHIPILLGTGRQGRYSEKVAEYVKRQIVNYDKFITEIIDVRDYATPITVPGWENQNPIIKKVQSLMQKADGLILVIPEYNHGYPGELKIFFDKIQTQLQGKSIAVCGVSSGGLGGARVVENFLPILVCFQMKIIIPAIYFSNIEKLFDEQGNITDNKYDSRLEKLLQKFN
ncbi:NAD(P)H-dependent oxidoreductase [Patescibacteria group bacterium]|nr:NAD(P)H-dependent oxidoreductase [Patescibacteria group bacterium]MBU0964550.1 NAD(P)H-dependent oxidoreductase [Patescibacteria group bacterium]